LLSSLSRNSQETKLKIIFEILWVLFEKISVFYSYLPKSWDMLEIFFINVIFITLQRKSFGQKSFELHAQVQKCHFARIEKKTWPKDFCEAIWSWHVKNISNMSQGLPNPGFRSVRVENQDFLKKDSQDFKNSFQFGFLWIPSKIG
jgi:hypothetical protein